MAKGNQNGNGNGAPEGTPEFKPLSAITAEQWKAACAAAGYGIDGDNVIIGVSDDNAGYLVPLAAPVDINMENLARALLGHALRVGQQGVKASKSPSRQVAIDSAASALNGKYKPSRDRSTDVVEKERDRLFREFVKAKVLAVKPDADDAAIDATVEKQAATDAGKEKLAEFRKAVIDAGSYAVARKGKATAGAIEIAL